MGGGMLDVAESPDEVQNLLTIKANGRPIQMNADHRGADVRQSPRRRLLARNTATRQLATARGSTQRGLQTGSCACIEGGL